MKIKLFEILKSIHRKNGFFQNKKIRLRLNKKLKSGKTKIQIL